MWESAVGHNTNALLGVGIPPNGTLTGTLMASAMQGLGEYTRGCYGADPIAAAFNISVGVATLTVPAGAPAVDRVVVAEDQRAGQLVRAFTLLATLRNGTVVALLPSGSAIGHKLIVTGFGQLEVASVALRVTAAAMPATLRSFALFGGCDALAAALDARRL